MQEKLMHFFFTSADSMAWQLVEYYLIICICFINFSFVIPYT